MKRFNIIYLIVLVLAIFNGCESEGVNSPENDTDYSQQLQKYFPYKINEQYEFKYDTLVQSTNDFYSLGKRILEARNKELINNKEYLNTDQKFKLADSEQTLSTKFRLTNKSILLLTDTTNYTQGIPDSLLSIMTIKIDEEVNILQLPLDENTPWPVVKTTVDFQTFKFNTVDVIGEYIGQDDVWLDGFNKSIPAAKIRYKVNINVPNFENPFLSNTHSYFSQIWFAEDYGIIKMEGCSFLLNPFIGMNIDFADTNKVSRHILTAIN